MSKIVTVKTGPNSYAQGELVGGSLVGGVGELVKWCHKLSRMAFAYGDIEASERYASAADALEAQAAEIERLREALKKLEYWFDADQEVLDAMTADELADHNRQVEVIRAALKGTSND